MVKLNKIYTRTGDDGRTGLADGTRRLKCDARIRLMGSVDETNAAIGVARTLAASSKLDALLARIQNDLFDLGADLAVPKSDNGPEGYVPLRIKTAQVDALEAAIDDYNTALTPLTSFILPGGSALSAHLHLARTVTRRCESDAVTLGLDDMGRLNPEILRYLNRLSDLLFVLARHANDDGRNDVLWVPGQN